MSNFGVYAMNEKILRVILLCSLVSLFVLFETLFGCIVERLQCWCTAGGIELNENYEIGGEGADNLKSTIFV